MTGALLRYAGQGIYSGYDDELRRYIDVAPGEAVMVGASKADELQSGSSGEWAMVCPAEDALAVPRADNVVMLGAMQWRS